MASIQFIRENPAFAGQDQANQASFAKLRLDEAMRTRDSDMAVDSALRDYVNSMPQPSGITPPQPDALPAQPDALPSQAGGSSPDLGGSLPPQPRGGANLSAVPIAQGPSPAQVAGVVPTVQSTRQPSPTSVATGNMRMDLARRLAAVPGGGQAALKVVQDDQAQQALLQQQASKATDNYFTALNAGNPQEAKYWADQAGINIPPEALSNAQFQQQMKQLGNYKALYGDDIVNFGRFAHDVMQARAAGQEPNYQAIFAKYTPTRQAPQTAPLAQERALNLLPKFEASFRGQGYDDQTAHDMAMKVLFPGATEKPSKVDELTALEDHYVAQGYTRDQAAAMASGSAAKVLGYGPNGNAAGGGRSVWQVKHDAWLSAHPGDENGALAYASGQRQITSGDARHFAAMEANRQVHEGIIQSKDYDAKVQELMPLYLSGSTSSVAPAPAAAPGPSVVVTPRGDPTAFRYRAKNPATGQVIYSQDNQNWVNGDGSIYQ